LEAGPSKVIGKVNKQEVQDEEIDGDYGLSTGSLQYGSNDLTESSL